MDGFPGMGKVIDMGTQRLTGLIDRIYDLVHKETERAERGEVGDLDRLLDVEMYLVRLVDEIERERAGGD